MNDQTVAKIMLDAGGSTRMDVSHLLPGIYLLRFTGCHECKAKVVIR